MTIKMSGCMKVVARMSDEDQEILLARLDAYQADGVPAKEAQRMAAADALAEVEAERAEMLKTITEQHADLVEKPAAAPEAEPEVHAAQATAAPAEPPAPPVAKEKPPVEPKPAEQEAPDLTPAVPRVTGRADLTPEQRQAQSNVFGNADTRDAKQRAKDAGKGLLGWLRGRAVQAVVDQFAPIKKLNQRAYMLSRLSAGSDGALEAQMLYGRVFVNEDGVYDVKLGDGGFAHVLADLKGEHELFLQWVVGLRSDDTRARGKENLISKEDAEHLKALSEGTMADGRKRAAVYQQALDRLTEYNAAVLDAHVASGTLSRDLAEMLKPHPYVPFYRELFDETTGAPKYSNSLTGQEAFKKLMGGTGVLHGNLLENVLTNWAHGFQAAAKNRAALATMDAALEIPGLVERAETRATGTVRVMRDGNAEFYFINDPHLLEAVSAMHYAVPDFMKPLATFKRMLTMGVTTLPGFKVKNLIRDSVQSIAVSGLGANVFKNVGQGAKTTEMGNALKNLLRTVGGHTPETFAAQNQTMASMLASGGLIRFASGTEGSRSAHVNKMVRRAGGKDVMLDSTSGKKLLQYMGDVLEAYHELGDTSEQVNRVALYEQLKAKGYSHAEASFMARDLLDFSMQGSAPVVRFLTQTVPFLNARLQGLYKLGRAAKEDPKRAGYVVGAVSLASLALMLAYQDDEDWKKREDWDRDSYWWFKIGDTAFRIPKPFEVGAIGTIAERTWELGFDEEMTARRYGDRVRHALEQTFAFNPVPQMFKPILDVYANRDSFTERAIEGFAMEQLRPEDRANENTSNVARGLGSLTGTSPLMIDHLLKGYFGGVATLTTGAIDMAVHPLTGRGERPTADKIKFFTSSLVTDLPADQSRYVQQLYDRATQVDEVYASYQRALKMGDKAKALELLEGNRGLVAQHQSVAAAKKQLASLNAQLQRIDASTSLSAESKKSLLTSLRSKRNAIAENLERRLPAF